MTDKEAHIRWNHANPEKLAEYRRRWALRHPEKVRALYERSKPRKQQTYVISRFLVKAGKLEGCVDCGEKDVVVLDYDHVHGQKKREVSTFLSSPGKLLNEIAKCEVRCANCHRRKTVRNGEAGSWIVPLDPMEVREANDAKYPA